MNTRILIVATSLFLLFLVAPAADASTAIQLDEQSALFTINFAVNDSNFDVAVPLLAKAGIAYQDRVNEVGYTIKTSEEDTSNTITDVAALVLSPNATLNGGRYELQAGNAGQFTLLIIATFSQPLAENYTAMITKLPYWLDGRRTTVHQNELNELDRPLLKTQ